ncbi:MAG: ATP-binding protein [Cyanobacteriota bacterium]
MNFFNDFKLSTKLNICVCSAIFICFMALGSYLVYKSYNLGILNAELQAQKESLIATKTIEKEFEKLNQKLTDLISLFLNTKELAQDSKVDYTKLLEASFNKNPYIISAYVIWEEGSEGYKQNKCFGIKDPNTNKQTYPYLLKDEGLILSCLPEHKGNFNYNNVKKSRKITITEPYIINMKSKEVMVVTIVQPMFNNEGKFLGVIAAEVNLEFLQSILKEFKDINTVSVLVSSNGINIMSITHPEWIGKSIIKDNKKDRKAWEKIKKTIIKSNNINSFSVFSNVNMLDEEALIVISQISFENSADKWFYYTIVPKKHALSKLYSNIKLLIVSLIVTLVVIIFINLLFIEKVITPRLNYLVESMKKIAQGQFNFKIKESSTNDELGALQNCAKSLHNDLKDLVENLENKVNERTKKLNESMNNLEIANKHKDKFLSALSHELRTPLNSIMIFSDLLYDQVYGELNEKQLQYISQIINNGEHLSEMINDLLDITRIESGKIQLNFENVSINKLLSDIVMSMESQFNSKNITVKTSFKSEINFVELDVKRFKQIIINLLSNALKFTPAQGIIEVGTDTLDESSIFIYVSDNGIGISSDQLGLIFSEFYQVETESSVKLQGLGLGLAITRRLVNLLGGEIYVESKLNEGSSFNFSLPIKQTGTSQRFHGDIKPGSIPENKRILIIEHNIVNLGIIIDILHNYNHKIYTAYAISDAMDLAITRNPEVILIDLSIPDLDYEELIRKIRHIESLYNVPIIAIASEVSDEIIITLKEYNITSFIEKPITRKKLLIAIINSF